MILCHKCSGVLAACQDEDESGLLGCCCISGYVRGFEPIVSRSEAIQIQIKQQHHNIALYKRQCREVSFINHCVEKIDKLEGLK